jgi:hypothetical protein
VTLTTENKIITGIKYTPEIFLIQRLTLKI